MERIENAFIRNHFQADYVNDAGGWSAIQSAVLNARRICGNPDKFPKANFDYLEKLDLEGTCVLLGAPVQYIIYQQRASALSSKGRERKMTKNKEITGWHFAGSALRDGRPLPKDGEWLIHEGDVVICETGLHASRRVIDALQYAPGSTICRVTCRGIVTEQGDKLVCRGRRIDWRIEDGDEVLRSFARKAALSVIHLWNAPDVVRRYLETGDETLRGAARDAAWDAAWAAARAAARDAAWAAAWDAVRDAAWDAARDAARAAARAAARDAARAAARDAARAVKLTEFNATLEQMLTDEHAKRLAACPPSAHTKEEEDDKPRSRN